MYARTHAHSHTRTHTRTHARTHTHIWIYIQLPCGPIPATVPGMGPKATKTTQNRHQKLSKNHQKLMPGGVPEALGGGLGTILVPGAPQRCPRDARRRKRVENGLGDHPPRDQLGCQIRTFRRFCESFSSCFFECRFGRPPGSILSGFGKVFRKQNDHF